MAPLIQPKSLQKLSVCAVSAWVDSVCSNIFLEFGCYGNEDCIRAVEKLQSLLVDQLPLTVFEGLADERNESLQHLLWSKDPRIKLSAFLHKSITRFNVDAKGNELMMQPGSAGIYPSDQDYGCLDEFFWCKQIARLTNLTSLNLNLITTDEILRVVGQNCLKLETVNVVSRIKQDLLSHEPGITLKFCVSDRGLKYLLNCKKLKRVTMNKIVNNRTNQNGITLKGIRSLVKKLPDLEYINFGSLGKVISADEFDSDETLKLTYYSELDPNIADTTRLTRTCPFIQHISLAVPIHISSTGNIRANVGPCDSILNILAESELRLKVVELQHFPYSEAFRNFLCAKGSLIEDLLYRANGNLDSKNIEFIGEKCPLLQKLHLKEVGAENAPAYLSSELLEKKLFGKLTSLQITGRMWSPNILLPLLIGNAEKMRMITLTNLSCRAVMDAAVSRVMQHNKLTDLISITLHPGCYVSMPVVRSLTYGCPALSSFSFPMLEDADLSYVEALKTEVTAANLDIKLCCLEVLAIP